MGGPVGACGPAEPTKGLGVDVRVVSDKGLVYGVALSEDYPRHAEGWPQHCPRGLVVMPANAVNAAN
jgi:hypothetical protein